MPRVEAMTMASTDPSDWHASRQKLLSPAVGRHAQSHAQILDPVRFLSPELDPHLKSGRNPSLCPPHGATTRVLRTGLRQDDVGDLPAHGAQHALRASQPPGCRLLGLLGPPLRLLRGGSRIEACTCVSRAGDATVR